MRKFQSQIIFGRTTYYANDYTTAVPSRTNRERLYIDAAWLGHSGIAYDSKFGLARDEQPEPSKASQIAQQLVGMLSQDELTELGNEVVKARDCKYGAAKDEDPVAQSLRIGQVGQLHGRTKEASRCGRQRDGLRASASDCDGCKVGIGIEAGIRAPWFSDIRPARASEDGFRCGNHEVVCRAVPRRR